MASILPVILAGGSGSRLWPLSRGQYPKQFLSLGGVDGSLLQAAVQRIEGVAALDPLVLCNEEHRFVAAEQLRLIGREESRIILEPVGRNTAPAIALAALWATRDGSDPVLLVMPADHLVQQPEAFRASVNAAVGLAEQGKLVIFGVPPVCAETGYGYIKQGEPLGSGFGISCFVEKPDAQTAQCYVQSGDYVWNSGMFMFRASSYLKELQFFQPQMMEACHLALEGMEEDSVFIRVNAAAFQSSPADSIDYAVMEKTNAAVMVPLDAGWSDIGSWSSLWEVSSKDESGNVSQGDVLGLSGTGNYVYAGHRLVATVGVSDLVVVETRDAVLVARKSEVQNVKQIVERLLAQGRTEAVEHREVYRPWGTYDAIDRDERYQVKRITVRPGAKLSLQMHHHRAEHWVVVSGTARITQGERSYLLTENQSTYIPVGQLHSLENPGKIPLELIEVQSGAYLGEDDIVRFSDSYGRCPGVENDRGESCAAPAITSQNLERG
ncbi:mannose-1-phosphate guanylyltransferase/mannose-6-phosphate isomerase [Ectopseudomonas mendocina]|nr:mannose-1-phosphate guanylyltransferase/mannose-6-phosphate isomerase [Pseudomonas mendocina]TRO20788.1 mannose-1-phosphate guanylyltransferase/mannose-6-phosphate isomerase [Pseudomonas mendocina]TRO24989.1 mannose-1-phosphate guanylyltransferase/mannose-6-phosphate isomerase [Pseudomonas mendocina]